MIERLQDDKSAICKGMFKRETDLSMFQGMKVFTDRGEEGIISGWFGKSGKFKVFFSQFPRQTRTRSCICISSVTHLTKKTNAFSSRAVDLANFENRFLTSTQTDRKSTTQKLVLPNLQLKVQFHSSMLP